MLTHPDQGELKVRRGCMYVLICSKEREGRATLKINCEIAFHLAVMYYSQGMESITNGYGVNSYKFLLAYNRVLRMCGDELLSVFERCKRRFPCHP